MLPFNHMRYILCSIFFMILFISFIEGKENDGIMKNKQESIFPIILKTPKPTIKYSFFQANNKNIQVQIPNFKDSIILYDNIYCGVSQYFTQNEIKQEQEQEQKKKKQNEQENDQDKEIISISFSIPKEFSEQSKDSKWIVIDPEYSTYVGGSLADERSNLDYDSKSNLYVSCATHSVDFPIVGDNVFNSTHSEDNMPDIALLKTKTGNKLVWSTFLSTQATSVTDPPRVLVDPGDDQPIVSGITSAIDLWPTNEGCWQDKDNCIGTSFVGFITKVNSEGTNLTASTLICAQDASIFSIGAEMDRDQDKETNGGSPIYFSLRSNVFSFPGYGLTDPLYKCTSPPGTNYERPFGKSLHVRNDILFFQGRTKSDDFPTTPGVYQETSPHNGTVLTSAFVGTLNTTSFDFIWASYFGGSNSEDPLSIYLDSQDNIWISGFTLSTDLPVTDDAYQRTKTSSAETHSGFLSKISSNGTSLLDSSYLNPKYEDDDVSIYAHFLTVDDDDHMLICGQGELNVTSYDSDYGVGSFAIILDLEANTVVRANTYGGESLRCQKYGNSLENFAVAGKAKNNLITSEGAFQEGNNGSYDLIVSGTFSTCPLGYYLVKDSDSDSCYECPKGTYSSNEKATSLDDCHPCAVGHYSKLGGSTQCSQCAVGSFNSETGKSVCQQCKLGQFQNATGQSLCHDCKKGAITTETGLAQCTECPIGEFQNEAGSSFCSQCGKGTYSESLGTPECTKCPYGTYNNLYGQTSLDSCVNCSMGTYGIQEGGTNYEKSCEQCPKGTWSDQSGAQVITACINCTAGFYKEKPGSVSQEECWPCPKGTYSDQEKLDSVFKCEQCPNNTISSSDNSTSCSFCILGSEINSNQDECVECPKGYYKNVTDSKCIPCGENSINNHIGMTYCLKCGLPGICLGGNECDVARDPESYCSQCLEGHYLKNAECQKCGTNWLWILYLLLILIIVILVIKFNKKISKLLLVKNNPIFEIYITFLQLFVGILLMNIKFPDYINNSVISSLSIFNFDLNLIIKPDCYQKFDFYSKYFIMVLSPFILIFVFLLIYVALRIYIKIKVLQNIDLHKINAKYFYYITLGLRYLYIPEIIICSQPFQTTYQEGLKKHTLDYYPSIYTDDQKYQNFYPWFIIFIIFYAGLIPSLFIVILYFSKRKNFSIYWENRFGWMWKFYKKKRFWWEISKMIFRFLIVIIPIFANNSISLDYLLMILVLLITLMMIIIVIFKPYPVVISQDKEIRNIKSFWEKISPEDITSIGLYLVLIATISSSIEKTYGLLFFFVNPIGVIFTFMGTRKNLKEMWYKNKKIKKFKTNNKHNKEINNLPSTKGKNVHLSSTSSSSSSSASSDDSIDNHSDGNYHEKNNDDDEIDNINEKEQSNSDLELKTLKTNKLKNIDKDILIQKDFQIEKLKKTNNQNKKEIENLNFKYIELEKRLKTLQDENENYKNQLL
ncbi:insulin-like growth factor binding proteinn-terminal [Anaeramoeba flamelloides]|uniref:Insulin-like growth factor binding proteinn-terminal n=1 Tax=Anaeramoeba flamelloides TaxID=1746091 RepID=A0AAV7YCX4_9EUKA|nr:insulin-like growth factor binding proteinn-terminal [Anaeramoeba flamelloides]